MRRTPIRVLQVLTAASGLLLGTLAVSQGDASTEDVRDGALVTAGAGTPPLPTAGQLDVDDQVAFWSARVERDSGDYLSRTQLAASLLRRAKARHDLGAAVDARSELERSLAVNPDHGSARALLAATYALFHDFERARDIALDAFDADPTNLVALATAGDAAFELGDLDAATALYSDLATRAGASPAVDARRARLAEARGDHATALSYARSARRAATNATASERAYYALLVGELHRGVGSLDAAAVAYRDALATDPELGAAIEALAQVRGAQGRLDEAEVLWRRSGSLIGAPDFHVLAARGDIAEARGDEALARDLWHKALNAFAALPDVERAGIARDVALFRADRDLDTTEAVRLARADLERRRDPYALATFGWTLAADGDDRSARSLFDEVREAGITDAAFAYRMAVVYERSGRTDLAVELLRPALAVNPRFDLRAAEPAAALLQELDASS